jgi:hypothetical protein
MSDAEFFALYDGEAIPIPESGMVLTVVEVEATRRCAPLVAPTPPLKWACELVQLSKLDSGPRGLRQLVAVWAMRRIDE